MARPGHRREGGPARARTEPTTREYRFRTLTPIPMQIDGEVLELDAGTAVAVEIAPAALATIL